MLKRTTKPGCLLILAWAVAVVTAPVLVTPVLAAPTSKTDTTKPPLLACASCACLEDATAYMFDGHPVVKTDPDFWADLPHCQGAKVPELDQSEDFRLRALILKEKVYPKHPRKICEADWRTILKGLEALDPEGEQKQNCKIPENVKNWTPLSQELGARCMADQYLSAEAHYMGVRGREGKLKNGCTDKGNHLFDMLLLMRMDTNIFLERENILARLDKLLTTTPDLLQSILLLYIHADQHPKLQKAAVERYKTLLPQGLIKPGHVTWLADRNAILENGQQIYGRQFRCEGGRAVLDEPLRDPDNVDARRAALGLPPLAEYLAQRSKTQCTTEHKAPGQ